MTDVAQEADAWYEDYAVGDRFDCGSVHVTAEDIVAFGRMYDPQAKHVDPAAAASSPFGALIASGWHTAALTMKLVFERGILNGPQALGAGADELRWLAPVCAGDTLSLTVEILGTEIRHARARRGTIRARMELVNQTGKLVFTQIAILSLMRRTPEAETQDAQR
jgi:acyl dehydratase